MLAMNHRDPAKNKTAHVFALERKDDNKIVTALTNQTASSPIPSCNASSSRMLIAVCASSEKPARAALTAPPELTVTAGNQSCTALRGGWIYEIRAGWDRMPDFEGNSSYTVFICME